jgi:hypothetical protein
VLSVLSVLTGLALMVPACAPPWTPNVHELAEESSADVLVPEAPFVDSYAFSLYPNWIDTYELLYNSELGQPEHVRAIQLNDGGSFGPNAFGEGFSEDELSAVDRARADASTASAGASPCSLATAEPEVHLCVYDDGSFLVRQLTTGTGDATVVAFYHDNPSAVTGGPADNTRYNPESIEGRFMTASFDAMPLDEASDSFLVSRG